MSTNSNSKEFDILKKNFDIAKVEEFDKYQLLTLEDKPSGKKFNICWFSLKISKQASNENYEPNNSSNYLEKVCKVINDWYPILKNPLNERQIEYDLFGETQNEYLKEELLPEPPKSDGNWNKYFNECHRIQKNNLMRKYTFLELFNVDFYLYKDYDWRQKLPTVEEVRDMYKVRLKKHKNNSGRFNDFWWDTPSYLTRDGALSDIELKSRFRSIRLHLLPYISYFQASYDMSYTNHSDKEKKSKIYHRFYLNGDKLSGNWCSSYENRTDDGRYKNLLDEDFLNWIRNELNIEKKEVISDEEIIKKNIESFCNSIFRDSNYQTIFDNSKNEKELLKNVQNYLKENNISNGGSSGVSIDGFHGSINYCHILSQCNITILQSLELRDSLNRNSDDMPFSEYYENDVIVSKLIGKEIFIKAFKLFKKENRVQTTLFDFLEAA